MDGKLTFRGHPAAFIKTLLHLLVVYFPFLLLRTLAAPLQAEVDDGPVLNVHVLVDGLHIPWDLTFTPDETMLFTQRSGVLNSRLPDGTVQTITADMGDLRASQEGGLMAILVDPGFVSNRRFYTCQNHIDPNEVQVIAWTINADYSEATRVADPLVGDIPGGNRHNGCRLRFGPDGHLWISTGDARGGTNPQDLTSLGGKVLRVNAASGAGAQGNPFSSAPLVYTYGHRNVQGLDMRPNSHQMWVVEHGPVVDDEINLLTIGGNYGWDPVPDYNESVPMTDRTKFPGAIEAKWSSGSPTPAISGGVFLVGSNWGNWEGRLAVAALKGRALHLFAFDADGNLESRVSVAELNGTYGRLRTPVMGPDGALYVTTSNGSDDKILRVTPSQASLTENSAESGAESGAPGGGLGGAVHVAPAFADGFRTEREVFESAVAGDPVGAPVVATHPDGLAVTYFLSGVDAAAFTVDEPTGQIRVREGASLVMGSSFTVNLTATDSVGIGSIIIVDIAVVATPFHEYDTNQDGRIDRDEVIAAIADYFRGEIEREEVVALIKLYFEES